MFRKTVASLATVLASTLATAENLTESTVYLMNDYNAYEFVQYDDNEMRANYIIVDGKIDRSLCQKIEERCLLSNSMFELDGYEKIDGKVDFTIEYQKLQPLIFRRGAGSVAQFTANKNLDSRTKEELGFFRGYFTDTINALVIQQLYDINPSHIAEQLELFRDGYLALPEQLSEDRLDLALQLFSNDRISFSRKGSNVLFSAKYSNGGITRKLVSEDPLLNGRFLEYAYWTFAEKYEDALKSLPVRK